MVIAVPEISYVDFTQMLLGFTTVVLGALAIAIALGSLIGYRSIKKAALEVAEKSAKEKLAEYFEGQALPEKLIEAIDERVKAEADMVEANRIAYILHEDAEAIPGGRVADDYPDEPTIGSEDSQTPEPPSDESDRPSE